MPREGPEPILRVHDIGLVRAFYVSLGFRSGYMDSNHYDIVRRGQMVVHLEQDDDLVPAANRASCYWRVSNADALHSEFAALGLPTEGTPSVTEPADEAWGMREFVLKDPAGNTIRVGNELRQVASPGVRD